MGDISLPATELKGNYQMKCDGHKIWIVNVSEKLKQIKPVEQRSYMKNERKSHKLYIPKYR